MAVSERRFGLEIECGVDGDVDRAINNIHDETGIYLEIDYDGTEFEFRTPVLQGDDGFEKLEAIYSILKEHGGYVTRADGAHVHHEALDYLGNDAMLARLVRSWVNIEPAIEKCVVEYRRGTYGACPQHLKKGDGTVKKIREGFGWSRGALNINNVVGRRLGRSYYGEDYCRTCDEVASFCWCDQSPPTVEVRLHEGSLDIEVMRPWIEMVQRLLDKVAAEGVTVRSCRRVSTLKSRLDLPDETAEGLIRKARLLRTSSYLRPFERSSNYWY